MGKTAFQSTHEQWRPIGGASAEHSATSRSTPSAASSRAGIHRRIPREGRRAAVGGRESQAERAFGRIHVVGGVAADRKSGELRRFSRLEFTHRVFEAQLHRVEFLVRAREQSPHPFLHAERPHDRERPVPADVVGRVQEQERKAGHVVAMKVGNNQCRQFVGLPAGPTQGDKTAAPDVDHYGTAAGTLQQVAAVTPARRVERVGGAQDGESHAGSLTEPDRVRGALGEPHSASPPLSRNIQRQTISRCCWCPFC